MGFRQLLQRRNGAVAVGFVACFDIGQNALETRARKRYADLFGTAFGTHLWRSSEENLEHGIGEYHRAHIAPVGHQPLFG